MLAVRSPVYYIYRHIHASNLFVLFELLEYPFHPWSNSDFETLGSIVGRHIRAISKCRIAAVRARVLIWPSRADTIKAFMSFLADLHIHSHFSIATSKDCDPEHLVLWACLKGITLVGTGDFTHPGWREELGQKLIPAEEGLYRPRPELEQAVLREIPATCHRAVRFILSSEISSTALIPYLVPSILSKQIGEPPR